MEQHVLGGYTAFRSFEEDEREMFDRVMDNLVGVRHEPLAVATQLVNGTNYAFLCMSTPIVLEPVDYNSLVIINKPLPHDNRLPMLLEIKTVKII